MDSKEPQKKMIGFGMMFAGALSIVLIIYNIRRKSNIVNSFLAKLANCILLCAMFNELMSGFIHFVYPYDCHHYISGSFSAYGIEDKNDAMTAMAMITSIWGGDSIIIGFVMMIPFLIDVDLFVTRFLLVISLTMRLIVFINLHILNTDMANNLSKEIPTNKTGLYRFWEIIQKTPVGKHLILLLLGIIFSLIGKQKKVDPEKESKKLN